MKYLICALALIAAPAYSASLGDPATGAHAASPAIASPPAAPPPSDVDRPPPPGIVCPDHLSVSITMQEFKEMAAILSDQDFGWKERQLFMPTLLGSLQEQVRVQCRVAGEPPPPATKKK